jgi:hypothetical protein
MTLWHPSVLRLFAFSLVAFATMGFAQTSPAPVSGPVIKADSQAPEFPLMARLQAALNQTRPK